jgi:hypothetical protein
MGGMSLGGGEIASHGKKKKKDRHAYHNVEAPSGSSAAFNGIPASGVPPSAYLNADPSTMPVGPNTQFLNQPITPQNSQQEMVLDRTVSQPMCKLQGKAESIQTRYQVYQAQEIR